MIPIGQDRVSRRFPAAMWYLLLVNVAVFIFQLWQGPAIESFVQRWGLVPVRLWRLAALRGEGGLLWSWMPLVTSMFLHGGWIHLLGNLLALRVFGEAVEDRLGSIRFLGFYLFCGVVAGLLHAIINAGSSVPTIGASGAIAGVLGAYLLLFPFAWVRVLIPVFILPFVIKVPAIFYLGLWIVTQILGGYQTLADGSPAAAGIAFWAHIGGFLTGMMWMGRRRKGRRS